MLRVYKNFNNRRLAYFSIFQLLRVFFRIKMNTEMQYNVFIYNLDKITGNHLS